MKEKRRGGSRGHCESSLTHRDCRAEVSLLPCVWVFLGGLCVSLFTGPGEAPPPHTHTHAYKHNLHTYMQAPGTPPEAGAENGAEKGIHSLCAELFNL